jgi:hypothetical protein
MKNFGLYNPQTNDLLDNTEMTPEDANQRNDELKSNNSSAIWMESAVLDCLMNETC